MKKKTAYHVNVESVNGSSPSGHQGTLNKALIDKNNLNSHHFELVHGTLAIGGGSDYHSHDVESSFYILKGAVLATVGGRKFHAKAGTAIFTPPKVKHKLKALTESEVLIIYSPQRSS